MSKKNDFIEIDEEDFEISEELVLIAKECFPEDCIDIIPTIVYEAYEVKKYQEQQTPRAEVSKQINKVNQLTGELLEVLSDLTPELRDMLHYKFFEEEIVYKGKFPPEKYYERHPDGIRYFPNLYQRLNDDLIWLNKATDLNFSPRGSWPKNYVYFLIMELAALWDECHKGLPKRSYNPYEGKESGKFRSLVHLALREIEPQAKAPDGLIRRVLQNMKSRHSEE